MRRSARRRRAAPRLGRPLDPVLRLRPQLPRPPAARHPGQADPGQPAHHRRPARPDRRALFRLLLLLHRHSGRLARRPHQPGQRAVARLRDLERRDHGLRASRPPIRSWSPRAWRSASARPAACRPPTRSSPTTSRPAGAASPSASTISARRSARRSASPSAPRSPPPSTGATPSSRSAWSAWSRRSPSALIVREPPRGAFDARPPAAQPAKAALLARRCGMFFSRPTLVLAALGSGATQFITYGARQFHHPVPDAREGHDARPGRDLVRARRR